MSTESFDRSALDRLHALGGASLVNEMLDKALENISKHLAGGRAAAAANDAKGVTEALHAIAGSAGNIGAVELETLARRGLAQAESAEHDVLMSGMAQMEDAYTRAQPLLREAQHGYD